MANGICTVAGCSKRATRVGHGWCEKHYTRWRRNGAPEALSFAKGRTPEQRYWPNVDTTRGPDACWEWQGGRLSGGYGSFRYQNKSWPAHRWLWVQTNGPIPPGLVVRHTCDNPPCCNPAHHLLGTNGENVADAVERDRIAYGSRNGFSKLTERDVTAIKAMLRDGQTCPAIAAVYGVTAGCINHISTGRTWKRVA